MRPRWMNQPPVLLSIAVLICFSANAQSDDLDVTMRMVTDDESLTDSVVREIELSRPILLDARPGKDTSSEARQNGRAFGQSVAEQARDAARLRKEEKFPGGPGNSVSGKPEKPNNPGDPSQNRN